MMEIVPLMTSHAASVARLHIEHLSTAFSGEPGRRLLTAYYRTVARGEGACGYIAQIGTEIVGYVCGVWDPVLVRQALFRRELIGVFVWGVAQIAVKPTLAFQLLTRVRGIDQADSMISVGYELRPIVLSPAWRGRGVAEKLVMVLLDDARRRSFDHIHLYADSDNYAAIRFYNKMGFTQARLTANIPVSRILYERAVTTQ
jgi:ribosomal protein S18 acetylase RimI-like enzyme